MLSVDDIKHRAVLMGICTGQMPDVEFIWSVQRVEGGVPCFGQGRGCCSRGCIWRQKCLLLSYFAEVALPAQEGLAEHTTQEKMRDKRTREPMVREGVRERVVPEGMREQRKQGVSKRNRKERKREKVLS